jgi:hypothetical protein
MCVYKNHAFIYFIRPPPWYGTVSSLLVLRSDYGWYSSTSDWSPPSENWWFLTQSFNSTSLSSHSSPKGDDPHLRMIILAWGWLSSPEEDYPHLRMIILTCGWISSPNGYYHLRMIMLTWGWLSSPEVDYLHLRMIILTWGWLSSPEDDYPHLMVIITWGWLCSPEVDYSQWGWLFSPKVDFLAYGWLSSPEAGYLALGWLSSPEVDFCSCLNQSPGTNKKLGRKITFCITVRAKINSLIVFEEYKNYGLSNASYM